MHTCCCSWSRLWIAGWSVVKETSAALLRGGSDSPLNSNNSSPCWPPNPSSAGALAGGDRSIISVNKSLKFKFNLKFFMDQSSLIIFGFSVGFVYKKFKRHVMGKSMKCTSRKAGVTILTLYRYIGSWSWSWNSRLRSRPQRLCKYSKERAAKFRVT